MESTQPDGIDAVTHDGVCRITVRRPATRNALTSADRWGLADALARADADPGCRTVVITGAGDHYCSGGDVSEFAERKDRTAAQTYGLTTAQVVFRTLRGMRTPTIARVRGVAAGAGMFLALGCDIVVADESAQFFAAHMRLGVVPDWGAVWLMPRLVGQAKAKALLLTGGTIGAADAAACGLIAEYTSSETLDERVDWYCRRIASFPARVVELTRMGIDRSLDTSLGEFLAWEATTIGEVMSSDEHARRVAEFLARQRGS